MGNIELLITKVACYTSLLSKDKMNALRLEVLQQYFEIKIL